MDRADLATVNELYQLLNQFEAALDNLEGGGRIVQMAVAPGTLPDPEGPTLGPPAAMSEPPGRAAAVTIPVGDMDPPPQMIDTLKALVEQKIDDLTNQLNGLGVTGVAEGRRMMPVAETPAAPSNGGRRRK